MAIRCAVFVFIVIAAIPEIGDRIAVVVEVEEIGNGVAVGIGAGSSVASWAGSNASPCSKRAMSAAPSAAISAWPWLTLSGLKSRSTICSARCSPQRVSLGAAAVSPAPTARPWRRALLWLALLGPFFFASYGFANWYASTRAQVPVVVFGWEFVRF